MIDILLCKQSEKDVISLNKVANASQSYFDTITQRLDSWQAKQQAIREAKAQVTKSFLLEDLDDVNGVARTYKLTVELVSTAQIDQHELELMEVMDYAN